MLGALTRGSAAQASLRRQTDVRGGGSLSSHQATLTPAVPVPANAGHTRGRDEVGRRPPLLSGPSLNPPEASTSRKGERAASEWSRRAPRALSPSTPPRPLPQTPSRVLPREQKSVGATYFAPEPRRRLPARRSLPPLCSGKPGRRLRLELDAGVPSALTPNRPNSRPGSRRFRLLLRCSARGRLLDSRPKETPRQPPLPLRSRARQRAERSRRRWTGCGH